jgi:hypothetical protein
MTDEVRRLAQSNVLEPKLVDGYPQRVTGARDKT